MKKIDILKSAMNICDIHSERINKALRHIHHIIPIKADILGELQDEEISFLDQITYCFAALQDTVGNKIFPLILELLEEDVTHASFIDKLNKLERIGAISSTEYWKEIRNIRNEITHEYPDQEEYGGKALTKCIDSAKTLTEYWHFLKKFIDERIIKEYK